MSNKTVLPAKPEKYGIKVFILANARNYYPCSMEVYTGKSPPGNSGNKPEDIVHRLCSNITPGHVVIGDNLFPSLSLSLKLCENKIFYLGMMRNIRREIPNELRDFKGISLYSSRFLFAHESMNMLVSYIAKKTKNVILLSNIHFIDEIPN